MRARILNVAVVAMLVSAVAALAHDTPTEGEHEFAPAERAVVPLSPATLAALGIEDYPEVRRCVEAGGVVRLVQDGVEFDPSVPVMRDAGEPTSIEGRVSGAIFDLPALIPPA